MTAKLARRRSGFTLIELLVVVAIIGVLVALLLPAVQQARESARASECVNHLRQLGLSVHSYHEVHRSFPPGNITLSEGLCMPAGSTTGYPSQSGINWAICLLPYIGEQALFESYQPGEFNESTVNSTTRGTTIALFTCPSDIETDRLAIPGSGPGGLFALKLNYRPGSYRAVTGKSDGTQFIDSAEFTNYPLSWRGAMHTVGIRGLGVETMGQVMDGASNTLLIGESTTVTRRQYRTFWAYSFAHYSMSSATPQQRTLLGDYDRCAAVPEYGFSQPCKRGWGSLHPSGINFLRVDGSVTNLSPNVSMELFTALATIAGGELSEQ